MLLLHLSLLNNFLIASLGGDFSSFGFFKVGVAVAKTKCAKMCGGSTSRHET